MFVPPQSAKSQLESLPPQQRGEGTMDNQPTIKARSQRNRKKRLSKRKDGCPELSNAPLAGPMSWMGRKLGEESLSWCAGIKLA